MSDEPQQPDFIAAMDQARRMSVELAKLVRDYYAALVEGGFTVEQALALTISFQMTTLTAGQA